MIVLSLFGTFAWKTESAVDFWPVEGVVDGRRRGVSGTKGALYSAGHLTNDRNYNYPARKLCGNIKDAIHEPVRRWD
jgi:hypothetical protein